MCVLSLGIKNKPEGSIFSLAIVKAWGIGEVGANLIFKTGHSSYHSIIKQQCFKHANGSLFLQIQFITTVKTKGKKFHEQCQPEAGFKPKCIRKRT